VCGYVRFRKDIDDPIGIAGEDTAHGADAFQVGLVRRCSSYRRVGGNWGRGRQPD